MATQKNKYTNIDLSKYDAGYQASQAVIDAEKRKKEAENAVANYGDFNYANQGAYDKALEAITNRKKFTYDLNADALYQQYKDNYITQGKQAMIDTMGQAAALTGGYGNSYAATVGNQTYQGYLSQLNNIAPELYKLALDKYNSEGTDLMNQFGILSQDRQTAYGEWGDKYNRLVGERDYNSGQYDAAYSRDYNAWNDNRSYDTTQYWNEYNAGYQKDRDAVADAQWQKEFELAQKKYKASLNSGGSGSSGTTATVKATDTSKVPDTVTSKLSSFHTNSDMNDYLNAQVAAGTITSEQAKSLYAQYRLDYDANDAGRSYYSLVDDGGANWFWGVDGNAVVMDSAGNKYTGDQLVNKLISQGYSKKEAQKKVKEIQKNTGAY